MLKSNQIEFVEFKIMVQSIPDEPEIVEHNYYEEYLKEKEQNGGLAVPEMGEVSPNNYQFESNNPSNLQQPSFPSHSQAASPANHSDQLPSPRSRELSKASQSPQQHQPSPALPNPFGSRDGSAEPRPDPARVVPGIRIEPPSFVEPSEFSSHDRHSQQHSTSQHPQPAGPPEAGLSQAPSQNSSARDSFSSVPNIRPAVKPQDAGNRNPRDSHQGSRLEDPQPHPQIKPLVPKPTPSQNTFQMEEDERPRDPKPLGASVRPPLDSSGLLSKKRLEVTLQPRISGQKNGAEPKDQPKPDPALLQRVEKDFENEQQMLTFKHKLLGPNPANPKELERYFDHIDRDNKQMKQALKHISDNLDGLSQEQQREKKALAATFGRLQEDAEKFGRAYGELPEVFRSPSLRVEPLPSGALSSRIADSIEEAFGEVARKVGLAEHRSSFSAVCFPSTSCWTTRPSRSRSRPSGSSPREWSTTCS
jgi:hypothetical protein